MSHELLYGRKKDKIVRLFKNTNKVKNAKDRFGLAYLPHCCHNYYITFTSIATRSTGRANGVYPR